MQEVLNDWDSKNSVLEQTNASNSIIPRKPDIDGTHSAGAASHEKEPTQLQTDKPNGISLPIAESSPPPIRIGGDRSIQAAPSESPSKSTKATESHQIEPQLLERFQNLAINEIPKRIGVFVDEQVIELELATHGAPPRHPFAITIKFEVKLKESQQMRLRVTDSNFPNQIGARRSSLKVSGKSMLFQSNVEPVLLRAERVMLGKFTKAAKDESKVIEAKLSIIAPEADQP